MLAEAGAAHSPDQAMKLNRWWVLDVIGHPRDDRGQIEPEYVREESDKPANRLEVAIELAMRRKVPRWRAESVARELVARQDARVAASKQGRRR